METYRSLADRMIAASESGDTALADRLFVELVTRKCDALQNTVPHDGECVWCGLPADCHEY